MRDAAGLLDLHVPVIRLSNSLMPEVRWNTHLACLQRLCEAAQRGLDLVEVAGLTGLAFRTALCTRATPASLYHTWAREPYFRQWLDALGLDAEVSCHDASLPSFDAWMARQPAAVAAALEHGFPVLYWDNLAYGLVLGASDGEFYISGIPAQVVHPLWQGHAAAGGLLSRLLEQHNAATLEAKAVAQEQLSPVLDNDALFVYVHGLGGFDAELAAARSLQVAAGELSGRLVYPRILDNASNVQAAEFGTAALARWREEMKDGSVHAFGMILNVQALAEARRLGWQYLKRLPERLPASCTARLQQACEFFERIVTHWRDAQAVFDVPLNVDTQMTRAGLEKCREAIYQVMQTEQTAGRLLAGIAQELFEA